MAGAAFQRVDKPFSVIPRSEATWESVLFQGGPSPLHSGGGAVILVTGRNHPGSAERSGERGDSSWSIQVLPDEGSVQHGAGGAEI